jgi:polyisoprenoid-binding protein YceI
VTTALGNEVRYRVREQLMGVDFPNDAIGKTSQVRGTLMLDSAGNVMEDGSSFTIDAATITSDKSRRDGFVRGRVLETEQYPTITFTPTSITGGSSTLPSSGTRTLTMRGNLVVKGVSHPTVWTAEATFARDTVSGTSSTAFTFDEFGLTKPRVPVVLSVADTIKLEYDFQLVRASQ